MIDRYAGPRPHEDWNHMNDARRRRPSRRTVREIERAMDVVPMPFVADPLLLRVIRRGLSGSRGFATWRRTTVNGQLFDDLALAGVGVGIVAATGWAIVASVTA